MINYLKKWDGSTAMMAALASSFQKLAEMLLKHLDGILNYCRTRVRFRRRGSDQRQIIRMLINRGRGL